ncbi:MAG: prepilin-type N-terminal cleavage/methylation domain-containing protein [Thiobacillus sp.]|nr:prepilin-type N-terminal cleavage/methylation domain-containing protein [Thiobacillus sp.]
MLNTQTKAQSGFGLVELMIGVVVGMIVVAAAMGLMTTALSNSNDNIKMARLDQELRQVMTMLSRDLRRATSWDASVDVARVSLVSPLTLSATSGNVSVTSPSGNLADIGARAIGGTLVYKNGTTVYQGSITGYSADAFSVTIGTAWPASAIVADGVTASSWSILRPESTLTISGTCILFASDNDFSGGAYNDNTERFGYRYDSAEKAVEARTAGASADGCSAGGSWENLTDEGLVEVTDFSVTDNSPVTLVASGFDIDVREFTISITGRLKADTGVVRTLQETVRVRNDRLSPS